MLRDLDGYLLGTVSAALLAALGLGAFVIGERRQLKSESAAYRQQASSLEGRLETLTRNQAEIIRLQREIPADPGFMQISRHEALVGLAAAIPDALTLTSLAVRRDNAFEIEAIVVGTGVDPDSLRRAFERSGFEPDPHNGWDFNAAAGRLAIRGKLGAPRT
jgi:Tfp pilus assembly protein PilN